MSGLSCSTRDLSLRRVDSLLWRAGFFLGVACGLQSAQAQWLRRWLSCPVATKWDLSGILVPRPGIEPMSPALEGGFLTTGPPGKSLFE